MWKIAATAASGVDSGFGYKTYEAVIAFQKMQGLPRTGRVELAFWRALWQNAAPRPRVRRGDYLEVDKSRQVVLEVRDGQVVDVIHASTGATGNTPVDDPATPEVDFLANSLAEPHSWKTSTTCQPFSAAIPRPSCSWRSTLRPPCCESRQ